MERTVVSLSAEDKAWLDRTAKERGGAMTELVRRAVGLLRVRIEAEDPPFERLLQETRGAWRGEDGLTYQEQIRDEW